LEGRRTAGRHTLDAVRLPMLLALAMLVSAGAPARAQLFRADSPQTPHPAVVRVIAAEPGGASLGSGTLVDANDDHGLVITNWHVVRDAPGSVIVVFPDGFQSMGRVLRMDSNWDLAAILINKPQASPVRVAREAPRIGEPLTIAGYGSGSYRSVAGACTQYLAPSLEHPYELVELAASARQGDSGGPILNSRGELAGVLFGEGGGRTTGAYCGRVHSFLTLAVEQLHKQGAGALAGGPSGLKGDPVPADWRARPSAPRHDFVNEQRVADNTYKASAMNQTADPPATALAPVAAIAPSGNITANSSDLAARPVGKNDLQPQPGLVAKQQAGGANSGDTATQSTASGWTAVDENSSLVQQFFAGDTLLAQLKTVLACLGALAIVFHGGRILAGKPAGKPTAKRAKR
jgi:hypothetical protein